MNQYMHIGGYGEVSQNSIFSAALREVSAFLDLPDALAQVRAQGEVVLVMQVTEFPMQF